MCVIILNPCLITQSFHQFPTNTVKTSVSLIHNPSCLSLVQKCKSPISLALQQFRDYKLMPASSKKVQFHKDIKRRRIRKSLSQRIKRLNRKENHYRTCEEQHVGLEMVKGEMVKVEARTKVFTKKVVFNYLQSMNRQVRTKVDFLFFGMMYIDEDALINQAKDRSLLRSLFNFYSINYVRITSDYLLVKIQKNYENAFPIQYIIERFKSLGDRRFYEMAEMVEGINQRMSNYLGAKAPSLYDQQVEKYLERLKGKLCITLISPNVIAFSRELLEMSGHSLETIANSCIANRSFLFDIFLSDNYMQEFKDHLSKFGLSKKLRNGEITPEEYTKQSCISSYSSIIDIHNNRIMFKSKRYNLDSGVLCWEIQQVIGREKLLNYQKFGEEGLEDYNAKRMQRDLIEVQNLTRSREGSKEEKGKVACGYRQSSESLKQEHD